MLFFCSFLYSSIQALAWAKPRIVIHMSTIKSNAVLEMSSFQLTIIIDHRNKTSLLPLLPPPSPPSSPPSTPFSSPYFILPLPFLSPPPSSLLPPPSPLSPGTLIMRCGTSDTYEVWYIRHCTEELRAIRDFFPVNKNKNIAVKKEASHVLITIQT